MLDLETNNHAVFDLNYHLILVVKYRRQVFTDEIAAAFREMATKIGDMHGVTIKECSVCHHVDSGNRHGSKFKCVKCGHTDHSDTNAAKVVRHRAIKNIMAKAVVRKQVKTMTTGRKVGAARAQVLADQLEKLQAMQVQCAGPESVPAHNTAGAAERARPKRGGQQAPLRLGAPAEGAERAYPRGKGRKTEEAKAFNAALEKRETPSSNHALNGRDHAPSGCG